MAKKKQARPGEGELKLQPLGDRVVVEREESEEKTSGGIILPDTAKNKPSRGVVVSVGDGRQLKDGTKVPLSVKPGDRVVYASYSGEEVPFKLSDQDLVLLHESDILAILE
jgi:chaperonin GroES